MLNASWTIFQAERPPGLKAYTFNQASDYTVSQQSSTPKSRR